MSLNHLKSIKFSAIATITEIANKMKGDVVRLEMGDVDFTTPEFISEAAYEAAKGGFTHYTPFNGYDDLKEAIAGKLRSENSMNVEKENVLVTSGASSALFIAFYSLLNKGDEVIIPGPYWSNFSGMLRLVGAKIKPLATEKKSGFKPDPDSLEKAITKNTKMLIINSPNNPTGAVFGKKLLQQIADIAEKHKLVVVSDEEYEKFVYGPNKHHSLGSMIGNTITVQSFSKTYAMCGWRIGYLAASKELVDEMAKVNLFTNICCSSVAQKAALAALKSDQEFTKGMVKEFERRGKIFANELNKIKGVECELPEGSLYVWPDVSRLGTTSFEVSKRLLEKAKVSTVPGSAFGKSGEGFLRLSLGAPGERLLEASRRIKQEVEN